MDIYSFINSKDIRKYLQKINYEFSPVEAAWLIWKCESISLEEKRKAWQEIIDTMPDYSIDIDEIFNFKGYEKSLHTFLKHYIDIVHNSSYFATPFDFFYINIPVPFKTGDIVCIKYENDCDNVFVYDKRNYENNKYISTTCYFTDCGRISHCYMHATDAVMNMEYFDKGVPSDKAILHTLSRHLKDEIPLDELLDDYLLNAFEDITDNLRNKRNLSRISKFPHDDDGDLPF